MSCSRIHSFAELWQCFDAFTGYSAFNKAVLALLLLIVVILLARIDA